MKYTIYQFTQEQYTKYNIEWLYDPEEYLCCSDISYWWYYGISPFQPTDYTWPEIFKGAIEPPSNTHPYMLYLLSNLTAENILAEICPTTHPELFI